MGVEIICVKFKFLYFYFIFVVFLFWILNIVSKIFDEGMWRCMLNVFYF